MLICQVFKNNDQFNSLVNVLERLVYIQMSIKKKFKQCSISLVNVWICQYDDIIVLRSIQIPIGQTRIFGAYQECLSVSHHEARGNESIDIAGG